MRAKSGNMTKSIVYLSVLYSFLLLSTTINARKDIGEYWRGVMHDQAMPQALQDLILSSDQASVEDVDHETKCHDQHDKAKNIMRKFDQEPNNFLYDNGVESTEKGRLAKELDQESNGLEPANKERITKSAHKEPTVALYDKDVKSAGKEKFVKEFDQESNVSVYDSDIKPSEKEKFSKVFDQEPNVLVYGNDFKGTTTKGKSFSYDFKPEPNVLVYKE